MPFNNRGAGEVPPPGAGFVTPPPGTGDVSPPGASDVTPPPSLSSLMWDSNSDTTDTAPLSPQSLSLSDFETVQEEQDRHYTSAMMYILPNGHYVSILI